MTTYLGKVIKLPESGFYNLETKHVIHHPQPSNQIHIISKWKVAGKYESLSKYATENKLDTAELLPIQVGRLTLTKVVRMPATTPRDSILQLSEADINAIDKYTLANLGTYGKVTEVYDGDTIHVVHEVPADHIHTFCPRRGLTSHLQKSVVRLAGIDAVELRTPHGKEARDILAERLIRSQNWIWIQFQHREKYGREMAYIWNKDSRGKSINEELIGLRSQDGVELFKAYDGGKRSTI